MAFSYFTELGLKKFGYYSFGKSDWMVQRGQFFEQIVHKNGGQCFTCPVSSRSDSYVDPAWKSDDEKTLTAWLKTLPHPIGILTANDTFALRLVSTCRKLDIAVPEEIAVLGVNNDRYLCQTLTPMLSSIDLGSERIGYKAAQLLDRLMQGKPLPKHPVLIPPLRVVSRQSTDMLAIENENVVESLRFIRMYATRGVSVRDVINALAVSSRSLERDFKQYVGRTVEKEIIRVRINHSVDLLCNSLLPNEEIAKLSGFGSLRYFLQVFHKEYGETPTQYRKRENLNVWLSSEDENDA
jgi:LacI family transcriptional regulator